MSHRIKTLKHLNEVMEKLSTDPEWAELDSAQKQKFINEVHENIIDEKIADAVKETTKKAAKQPKASRKPKVVSDTEESH